MLSSYRRTKYKTTIDGKIKVHITIEYSTETEGKWVPTFHIRVVGIDKPNQDKEWRIRWDVFDVKSVIASLQLSASPPLPPKIEDELRSYIKVVLDAYNYYEQEEGKYLYDRSILSEKDIPEVVGRLLMGLQGLVGWRDVKNLLRNWGGEKLRIDVSVEPDMGPSMTAGVVSLSLNVPNVLKELRLIKGMKSGTEIVDFDDIEAFFDKWAFLLSFFPGTSKSDFIDDFDRLRYLRDMGAKVKVRLVVNHR